MEDCSLDRTGVNQTTPHVGASPPLPGSGGDRPHPPASRRLAVSTGVKGTSGPRLGRLGAARGPIIIALLVLAPGLARAQAPPPRLPNPGELAAAKTLIDRGVVALVEPSPGPTKANILLLGKVRAPAKTAYQVVATPERYPEFMGALDEVEVTSRRGRALVYRWQWKMGGVHWRGLSAMAQAPPHDIAVQIMRSDLGTGRFRWHFYPEPDGTSLIAESLALDLSSGHRVIRWLTGRGAAMSSSVTLTLGIVLLEGSRQRARQLAGSQAPARATPPTSPAGLSPAEVAALSPLLDRGAVVLLESNTDGSFRQAVVVEAIDAPRQRVLDVLHHPERWQAAVPVISDLEITGRHGDAIDARIAMNLSIFEVDGTVRITPGSDGVELRGTGGGLAQLRLRFRLTSLPDGRTVLQSTGRSRAAQAAFFLRQLVRSEPNFEHGLNSAAQLLFVRGLAAAARSEAD